MGFDPLTLGLITAGVTAAGSTVTKGLERKSAEEQRKKDMSLNAEIDKWNTWRRNPKSDVAVTQVPNGSTLGDLAGGVLAGTISGIKQGQAAAEAGQNREYMNRYFDILSKQSTVPQSPADQLAALLKNNQLQLPKFGQPENGPLGVNTGFFK